MSRQRPSDQFTRFTSNTPHANNASSSSSSNTFSSTNPQNMPSNFSSRQPRTSPSSSSPASATHPNETPAERVARLRAAHARTRAEASLTPVDRLIARGRTIADATHRITTYGLLAFTGVAAVVAGFSLVSLVAHNRRQKRAWIEREMGRLHDAQQAFLRGEANAEQLHLLEQERAGEEMAKKYKEEKARNKKEGYWNRLKETFGTLTSSGDKGVEGTTAMVATAAGGGSGAGYNSTAKDADKLLSEGWIGQNNQSNSTTEGKVLKNVAVQESGIKGVGLDDKGRPVPINKVEVIPNTFDNARRRSDRTDITTAPPPTGVRTGGPLDVMADNMVSAATTRSSSQSGSSWFGWVTGGGGGGSKST